METTIQSVKLENSSKDNLRINTSDINFISMHEQFNYFEILKKNVN